jgi:hypothetical protein
MTKPISKSIILEVSIIISKWKTSLIYQMDKPEDTFETSFQTSNINFFSEHTTEKSLAYTNEILFEKGKNKSRSTKTSFLGIYLKR